MWNHSKHLCLTIGFVWQLWYHRQLSFTSLADKMHLGYFNYEKFACTYWMIYNLSDWNQVIHPYGTVNSFSCCVYWHMHALRHVACTFVHVFKSLSCYLHLAHTWAPLKYMQCTSAATHRGLAFSTCSSGNVVGGCFCWWRFLFGM